MSTNNKKTSTAGSAETLFKVLHFIGRYRLLLISSIILASVSVVLQLYVPVLFGDAIDQIIAEPYGKLRDDVVLSFQNSCDGHRVQSCCVGHEYHQQPYDISHSTGYPFQSDPPYPGTSPLLSGWTQYR